MRLRISQPRARRAEVARPRRERRRAFYRPPTARRSRRQLRTSKGPERLNKDIKRHTGVPMLLPNESFLLWVASAVICGIRDDW